MITSEDDLRELVEGAVAFFFDRTDSDDPRLLVDLIVQALISNA